MSDDTLVNHYDKVPKKFKEDERHYETEKTVQIKLPFRMVITGASGSGKTNALINIIQKINAFDKIMIWAKDTEEPLYASFIDDIRTYEKKHGASILTVSNTIADLPSVDSMNKENNTVLVIDDMVTEKDKALSKVSEYFIRGRKKNVSPIFLTQSYFDVPTIIRKQCSYFIFTKISGERDLNMILKDFRLGISEEQIMKLYNEATKGGFPNFFMIDLQTNDKDLRFRRNFKGITAPAGDTEKPVSTNAGQSGTPGASGASGGKSRRTTQEKPKTSQAPKIVYSQKEEVKETKKEPPHERIVIDLGKNDIYGSKRQRKMDKEPVHIMVEDPDSEIFGMDQDDAEDIHARAKVYDKDGDLVLRGGRLRKRRRPNLKQNLKQKTQRAKGLDRELTSLINRIR